MLLQFRFSNGGSTKAFEDFTIADIMSHIELKVMNYIEMNNHLKFWYMNDLLACFTGTI